MENNEKSELISSFFISRAEAAAGRIACLRFKGTWRNEIIPALNELIESEFKASRYHIVLNLSRVEILASSHLGMLFSHYQTARQKGGNFHICGLNEALQSAFERLNLHNFIHIFTTEPEAVEAMSSDL